MRGRTRLALTIMMLLTACGGSAGGDEVAAPPSGPKPVLATSGGAAGGEAAIVAKDLAFEPKEVAVAAGAVRLTLTNVGVAVHTLVFDDGVPKFDKLETGQGEEATATMNLPPGTYSFFCDQPGHRGAGMEGTLVVT